MNKWLDAFWKGRFSWLWCYPLKEQSSGVCFELLEKFVGGRKSLFYHGIM